MRDLEITKKTHKGVVTTSLFNHGIEVLTVNESYPIASVDSRAGSALGYTSHYGRLVDKTIEVSLTFLAKDKFDYYNKEMLVFDLFSYSDEVKLTLFESLADGYDFEKPSSYREYNTSRKKIKNWDVILESTPEISRSGLRGNITVVFKTSQVPFSYFEERDVVFKLVDFTGGLSNGVKLDYKGTKSLDVPKILPSIDLTGIASSQGFILEANNSQLIVEAPITQNQHFVFDGYSYTIGNLGVSRKTNYGGLHLHNGENIIYLKPRGTFTAVQPVLKLNYKEYNY